MIAKNAHISFMKLTDAETSNERVQEFTSAEKNYVASTRQMSQRLADSYVNFDHICIGIALICLASVRYLPTLSIRFFNNFFHS